jgi:putative ABC transport system substrate-binding protein
MYPFVDYVEVGGLMFFGPNRAEPYRHMARQIDRILRGELPGEIPFYQPTQFEFVINLKAAKALGLSIPPMMLARADEVIE